MMVWLWHPCNRDTFLKPGALLHGAQAVVVSERGSLRSCLLQAVGLTRLVTSSSPVTVVTQAVLGVSLLPPAEDGLALGLPGKKW